jgi:hypothetical protein
MKLLFNSIPSFKLCTLRSGLFHDSKPLAPGAVNHGAHVELD